MNFTSAPEYFARGSQDHRNDAPGRVGQQIKVSTIHNTSNYHRINSTHTNTWAPQSVFSSGVKGVYLVSICLWPIRRANIKISRLPWSRTSDSDTDRSRQIIDRPG